ncbi:peptidoglycan DD-metalloendopeptidase family protein [Nodosilinea sp. E11]|uniref:peptidoglycan DD-metalloendopeptidase family protein n=1 Tax=Nodosilinea sp. E11 TaxID=3037479 RepID=UPI002934452B|nr:peptidoglycan DD-metalloendopeptidase family protein [Nodosilinea sp. E11]WOD41940.1 peptidoglycan DD-metalloendopeptidase family protein [Nodosilinea sp. E11]
MLTEPELALAADGSTLTVLPAASRKEADTLKTAPSPAVGSSAYHTVEPGESLWQIAAQHEADVQAIKAANGIASDEVLRAGQVIRVPAVGLANLVIESDSPRLALKGTATGGVGGDMVAAAGLLPNRGFRSVDDLKAIGELEAPLTAEELEALAEAELAEAELAEAELAEAASESLDIEANAVTGAEVQPAVTQLAAVPTTKVSDPVDWSVSEVENAKVDTQAVARTQDEVAATAPASEASVVLANSLPLHTERERPVAAVVPTPVPAVDSPAAEISPVEATETSSSKKDLVAAALPLRPVTPSTSLEAEMVTSYQVKPGDTLWSIASRNGVTLEDLLSHNGGVTRPESLAVGDRLALPVASAAVDVSEVSEPTALPTSSLATASPTREEVIQNHLARIRESNSALVDREQLNARIREARLELERSRNGEAGESVDAAPVSLEYYTPEPPELATTGLGGSEPTSETALMVREGAQTATTQWTVTDAAPVAELAQSEPQQVATLNSEAERAAEASAQLETVTPSSQLLAAAPLGADAYQVLPNLPVGQTVSPNMPMLPGANEFLPEAPTLSNGFIWPTQGTFTSGYGWRWGRMHRGIDIAGPVGTPIVASAAGTVVRSGWNSGGYGNLVDIRHPDGSMTRYAHNSRLLVRQGEQVRQGQQIAEMGSTGYSTGPHLHFEVHLPSSGTVNPMAFLPGR